MFSVTNNNIIFHRSLVAKVRGEEAVREGEVHLFWHRGLPEHGS